MNEKITALQTKELAEELVAFEAASGKVTESDSLATCRVCEKLRRPLVTLAGTAGFASLLSRALTLAKRQAPALYAVTVRPDGTLEGLVGEAANSHLVLVTCLLDLLVTFIGETLTIRILDDIWPGRPGLRQMSPTKEAS